MILVFKFTFITLMHLDYFGLNLSNKLVYISCEVFYLDCLSWIPPRHYGLKMNYADAVYEKSTWAHKIIAKTNNSTWFWIQFHHLRKWLTILYISKMLIHLCCNNMNLTYRLAYWHWMMKFISRFRDIPLKHFVGIQC